MFVKQYWIKKSLFVKGSFTKEPYLYRALFQRDGHFIELTNIQQPMSSSFGKQVVKNEGLMR